MPQPIIDAQFPNNGTPGSGKVPVGSDANGNWIWGTNTVTPPQRVTALPGSPTDGLEVFFVADETNDVVWHLRYNGAATAHGTYKWEFVGGPPLHDEVATEQSTSSTSYADLATVGPQITVPLAGDYLITGAASAAMTVNAAIIARAAIKIGAAATADADAVLLAAWIASASTRASNGARTLKKTALAASTVLKMQYKNNAASAVNYGYRSLDVLPIRVA